MPPYGSLTRKKKKNFWYSLLPPFGVYPLGYSSSSYLYSYKIGCVHLAKCFPGSRLQRSLARLHFCWSNPGSPVLLYHSKFSQIHLCIGASMAHHSNRLKADRPHPCNYLQTPNDYRHTENNLRLVMVVVALFCTRQSRAPNIGRCSPEIWYIRTDRCYQVHYLPAFQLIIILQNQ